MEKEIKQLRKKFCLFSSLISLLLISVMILILNLMLIFLNRQEMNTATDTARLAAINGLADVDTEIIKIQDLKTNEGGDRIIMRDPRLIDNIILHGRITCGDPEADWYCAGGGIFFEMPYKEGGYYLIQKEYKFNHGDTDIIIDFTKDYDLKYRGEYIEASIADVIGDKFLLTQTWWTQSGSEKGNKEQLVELQIESIYIKYKGNVTPLESCNYQMLTRNFAALYPKDVPQIFNNFSCFYFVSDKVGNIIEINSGNLPKSISYDEINSISEKKENVEINGVRYKHETSKVGEYNINIFISNIHTNKNQFQIIWVSVLSGLVIYFILLIMLYILSGKAIKPILESNEKQKRFISNASHELKTPLTVIKAATELMEKKNGADSLTSTIQAQLQKMSTLVNEMLSLSKLSNQKETVNIFGEFDLSHIVCNTALYFESLAYENQKYIETNIQENIGYTGISENIEELVGILLENAIKYSDENAHIKLSLFKENGVVILNCTNPCKNFKPDSCTHLFERFYRGDTSHSDKTSGYGLGLSIAKEIVIIHKGEISASYKDGDFFIIVKL